MFDFSLKLSDIVQVVGGELSDKDSGSIIIKSFATSPETSTDEDIVFVYAQKYLNKISSIKAKAMILPVEVKGKVDGLNVPVIFVERPKLVLKKVLGLLEKPKYRPEIGVHSTAQVDSTAKLGKNCAVGANVFIGPNTIIGDNATIYPNTYIGSNLKIGNKFTAYSNCSLLDYSVIGNNVVVFSGAVIGADGFSYITEEEGNIEKARKGDTNFNTGRLIQHKVPTIGNVVIEDDVEVGANTTIDVATFGSTIVKEGTKVDNLVMVAHNAQIGKDCLIVAQTAVAGSVKIGDRVIVGGQAALSDNLEIGDDCIIAGRAGVHSNVPPANVYIGTPAHPYKEFINRQMNEKRIPRKTAKLEDKVKKLEEKIEQLEEKLGVKA